MNKLLRSFLLSVLVVGTANAQVPATKQLKTATPYVPSERSAGHVERPTFAPPASPLAIDVPNGNQLPLRNFFPAHTNGRALHNIQVDPSNPSRVHAALMADPSPALADTATSNYFPGRRVYYLFSSDAGVTWSTPKSLSSTRAGYPDLILYKKGDDYLPLIAIHRADEGTDDYRSVLMIGTGAPGSGEFTEVTTDREHATAGVGDLLWPGIALSPNQDKVYMIASLSPEPSTAPIERIQFTTFNFDAAAGTATWNGPWKNGPGDDAYGIETGGMTVIRTSPSGKVGIMWVSDAEFAQNLHLSESNDGGNTWSDATIPVYERTESMQNQNGQLSGTDVTSYMVPQSGLDFFYAGEQVNAVWSAYATTDENTYYPSIASIMHWKQGGAPVSVLSRLEWTEDYEHKFTQGELAFFPVGIGTTPQGAHLEHSTIARTDDWNKWSIVYQAWMDADTSEVYNFFLGDDVEESYAYRSIWQMTTTDGGATWADPVMIQGHPVDDTETPTLDFRFPQVSSWNPMVSETEVGYQLLYAADTLGGLWYSGGVPIWGDMAYFSQRLPVEVGPIVKSVKRTGTTEILTLDQNYPNPFNPSTTVSFSVKEAAQVRLVVEDMMGREVATIFEGFAAPGKSEKVKFDASSLTSGVYQYVLKTENESVARRMVLAK